MDNNNEMNVPILSIKTIEKKMSRTYTDDESVIKKLESIGQLTHRSLNDVLKELVNNFISNGMIYDPDKKEYYTIDEMIEKYKELETLD